MFDDHSDLIRDIVLEAGLINQTQADEVWESHASTGKSFADGLMDAGLADRPSILQAIADHLGVQYYSVIPATLPDEVVKVLKPAQAHKYMVVPVSDEAGKLTLVAKDPFNSSAVNELTFILKRDIEIAVADPQAVEAGVIRVYGEPSASSIEDLLGEFDQIDGTVATEEDVANVANQAPIIRFVDLVLQEAVKAKASDIHFTRWHRPLKICLPRSLLVLRFYRHLISPSAEFPRTDVLKQPLVAERLTYVSLLYLPSLVNRSFCVFSIRQS